MNRNEFLDFVKGVLITLVCIGHTIQFLVYKDKDFWNDPIFKLIYIFHMPLFMAIAGYVSFYKISTTDKPLQYIKNRVQSYLVPIFTWSIIFNAVFLLSPKHQLEDYPREVFQFALGNLWFLWALLGSILLMVIASISGKYRKIVLSVLVVLALLIPNVGLVPMFKYTFPFFIAGYILSSTQSSLLNEKYFTKSAWVLLVASCVCYCLWNKNTYIYVTGMELSVSNLQNIMLRWFAGSVLSLLVIVALRRVMPELPIVIKKYLIIVGKDSIYVYVIQTYAFMVLVLLLRKISPSISGLGDLWKAGGAVVWGIIITYCCWYLGFLMAKNKIIARYLFGKLY